MSLSKRDQKQRQMVRGGYAGIGVGVILLLFAISAGSIIFGVLGIVVLAIAAWATKQFRSL
jgi:hypothetical protein